MLSAHSAVAQESASGPEINQTTMEQPTPTVSGAATTQVGGFARTEAAYYPSPVPGNPRLSQSLQGEVNFQGDRESSLTSSKVDITFGRYFDWDSSYYSVQQLFTGLKFNSNKEQVFVGRKLEFWSEVDKDWQLGLWEPQFRIDPLQQVDQGLTGLFYQQSVSSAAGTFDWVMFGSPIFIPTTGPDIREDNGNLVSESRWYQQPASSGNIQGQNTQFVYSLSVPAISQLVNNPGSGLRLRWSENADQHGFWSSVNYAYKPVNTLTVKYDANLMVAGNTSQINVVPVVAYANLWGGDFGYKSSNLGNFSFSYLEEDPTQKDPTNDATSDWWQQQLGQLHIYSLHWDSDFKVKGITEKVNFAVEYLRVFENNTQDVDSDGIVHNAILPYQTMYTNALSLRTRFLTYLKGKKLISKFRVTRDFSQNGNVYESELDWSWTRRLTFNGGLDVISPDDPSANNPDPSFINQFRANDRIYAGCSYVF
jgi:hypothetical protein